MPVNLVQHKGRSPKRTNLEKEHDRKLIKEALLKGKDAREICQEMGIPYNLIMNDIQHISSEWQRTVITKIETQRLEQAEKLNMMEKELWKAWHASQQSLKKTTTSTVSGNASSMTPNTKRHEVMEEVSPGDVKIMEAILKCIQERNKLFGLYAMVTTQTRVEITRDHSTVKDELLEMIEQARLSYQKNQAIIDALETQDDVLEAKQLTEGEENNEM